MREEEAVRKQDGVVALTSQPTDVLIAVHEKGLGGTECQGGADERPMRVTGDKAGGA